MAERPVDVDFDHDTEAHARDPHPIYAELRATCPVAHTSAAGGFWVVSRYEDIVEVTRNSEVFSSRIAGIPPNEALPAEIRIPPLTMDPPEHTRVKRMFASWFSPQQVAKMEPTIRASVRELIEPLRGQQTCDVSTSFARIVPARAVGAVMGVPPGGHEQFYGWLRRILEGAATDPDDAAMAIMEFVQFVGELVAERKQKPGTDLISYLAHVDDEGRLTDEEITLASMEILGAGIDTVWSTLTSSLLYLARNPDQQQMLREHPERIEVAREELLRAFSPVAVTREVTQNVELRGVQLERGELLFVSFLSANRDEAAFADADEVVLDREVNRHLAFGSGIHRCVGSNLARLELSVALEEFLRELPPFVVDDEEAIEWSRGMLWGPRTLPLRFGA